MIQPGEYVWFLCTRCNACADGIAHACVEVFGGVGFNLIELCDQCFARAQTELVKMLAERNDLFKARLIASVSSEHWNKILQLRSAIPKPTTEIGDTPEIESEIGEEARYV